MPNRLRWLAGALRRPRDETKSKQVCSREYHPAQTMILFSYFHIFLFSIFFFFFLFLFFPCFLLFKSTPPFLTIHQ